MIQECGFIPLAVLDCKQPALWGKRRACLPPVPYSAMEFCLFREEIQDFLNCIDASLEELQAMLSGKQYNFGAEAFSDVSVFSLFQISEKYCSCCLMECCWFIPCCNG